MNTKAYVAEFIGTFALCFIGIAAIQNAGTTGGDGLLIASLAHGFTIAVLVAATFALSGAHLNPAVTITTLVTGKLPPRDAPGYLIAQILGALLAGWIVMAAMPGGLTMIAKGTPVVAEGVTYGQAFVMEVVLTFFLMFVIYGAAIDRRNVGMAPLFIGLVVSMDIFAGGPVSGAAMNPARHLGPALACLDGKLLGEIWLYWLAPVAGALIAGLLYHHFLEDREGARAVEPTPEAQLPGPKEAG